MQWRRVGVSRLGRVLALGSLVLLGGCARTVKPPCTIIPAQLDLAKMRREKAKAAFEAKRDDAERVRSNNDVSVERLGSLEKERAELLTKLAAAGADSVQGGKP